MDAGIWAAETAATTMAGAEVADTITACATTVATKALAFRHHLTGWRQGFYRKQLAAPPDAAS